MAIKVESERLIELRNVPAELESKIGKRLNLATVYRWKQRGIAGVRLEVVKVGGASFTSWEALNRFFAVSSTASDKKHSDATRKGIRISKQREREAEALGI